MSRERALMTASAGGCVVRGLRPSAGRGAHRADRLSAVRAARHSSGYASRATGDSDQRCRRAGNGVLRSDHHRFHAEARHSRWRGRRAARRQADLRARLRLRGRREQDAGAARRAVPDRQRVQADHRRRHHEAGRRRQARARRSRGAVHRAPHPRAGSDRRSAVGADHHPAPAQPHRGLGSQQAEWRIRPDGSAGDRRGRGQRARAGVRRNARSAT